MKRMCLILLMVSLTNISFAADEIKPLQIKVISQEINSVTGQLSINLEYTFRETVTLQTTPTFFLPEAWSFSILQSNKFNNITYSPTESFVTPIQINYPIANIPFYPKSIKIDQGYSYSISDRNSPNVSNGATYAEARIYFTPYNTTEIWNIQDYYSLKRNWTIPTLPEPTRVFIPQSSIPASDIPYGFVPTLDWQDDFRDVFVEGLAYSIPMMAIDPANIPVELLSRSASNKSDDCGLGFRRFKGNIVGNIQSIFLNDIPLTGVGNNFVPLSLKGINVEIWEKNAAFFSIKLGETSTDANGNFSKYIDICRLFTEGNNIEIFLKIKAHNTDFDIKGKSSTFWGEVQFEKTDVRDWSYNNGDNLDFNFGSISITNEALKATYLATLAWEFSNQYSGTNLENGLLIRTEKEHSLFVPNEYCGMSVPVIESLMLSKPTIYLETGDVRSENDVYHEFGHFLMWQLQQKCWIEPKSGSFAVHGYNIVSNSRIGWTEGWADAFMAICDAFYFARDNEATIEGGWNHEDRNPNRDAPNFNIIDGICSEYNISCALFDLWDGGINYPSGLNFNDINTWDTGVVDDVSIPFSTICSIVSAGDPNGSNQQIESVQGFYDKLLSIYQCNPIENRKIVKCFVQNRVVADVTNHLNTGPSSDDIFEVQAVPFSGSTFEIFGLPILTWSYTFNEKTEKSILNTSNDDFNYAQVNNNSGILSDNLFVTNGAFLYFNKYYYPGFLRNHSSNRPPLNATFNVDICSNMMLEASNNGNIEIGDQASPCYAVVRVKSGSILKLGNNGKLRINNNSKLIIESGAKLIYEPGAQIELSGANAILEIQGSLQIENNATFSISGDGFIRFNSNTFNYLIAGAGTSFRISGTGQNSKRLEVLRNPLIIPNTVNQFWITDCKVELGNESQIQPPSGQQCYTHIRNVNFTSTATSGYGGVHHGLGLFGQSNVNIVNCSFNNGKYGIYDQSFIGGKGLTVSNSTFNGCEYGIKTNGAGINVYNSNFSNNSVAGIYSEGLQTPSNIKNCTFNRNVNAIHIDGQFSIPVNISNTIIDNIMDLQNNGIRASGVFLNLKCATITNCDKAIMLFNNATLNMSTTLNTTNPVGGYNKFFIDNPIKTNKYTISANNANTIYFDNGYNNLINGFFPYETAIYGSLNQPSSLIIDAKNNIWREDNNPPDLGMDYWLYKYPFNGDFVLEDNSPIENTVSCGYYDPTSPPSTSDPNTNLSALKLCPTCNSINTTDFSNVKYNEAISSAMADMELEDSTKNDLDAIRKFYQILMLPIDSSNKDVLWLASLAYPKMIIALTNAFNTGRISTNDNIQSLHPSVQQVLDVQNRLSTTYDINNFKEQFYLDMSKAHIYRLAGRFDLSLQQLNAINSCYLTENEILYLKNWKIQTKSEDLVLTEQVPKEKFDSLVKEIKYPQAFEPIKIDSTANINTSIRMGYGVTIGSNSTIEPNVKINDNVTIGNNVTIKQNSIIGSGTTIGDNTIIEKDVVIGQENNIGSFVKIKKNCKTGNNVNLSDRTEFDEGLILGGFVTIGSNTKLKKDILVADGSIIGSNNLLDKEIKIGSNVIILNSVNLKKTVLVGDRSFIGNNVTINNNVKIGSDAVINDNITIVGNINICNSQIIENNINNNVSNCTLQSFPSSPLAVLYDCSFATNYAKNNENFYNGFTAKNAESSMHSYCTEREISFKPNKLSLNYLWNFGDCSTSTDENPIHFFSKPGVYTISLTQNLHCENITTIGSITVLPTPQPSFIAIQECGIENSNKILFNKGNSLNDLTTNLFNCQTGLCSIDPKGIDSTMFRIKYNWNFGSSIPDFEEVFSFLEIAKNLDSNVVRSYPTSGAFLVSLKATLQKLNKATGIWANTDCIKIYSDSVYPGKVITTIKGTVISSANCGSQPEAGLTLALKDENNQIIEGVSSITTDNNGFFVFNPNEIALLDSNMLVTIVSTNSSLQLEEFGYAAIYDFRSIENLELRLQPIYKQWEKHYHPNDSVWANAQVMDLNGNLYIAGYTRSEGFVTLKYNASGMLKWVKQYSQFGSIKIPYAINTDANQNIIVTGTSEGTYSNPQSIAIVKYDSIGNVLWSNEVNIGSTLVVSNFGLKQAVDPSGNLYIVTTAMENTSTNKDIIMLKYSSSGVLQWQKRINGATNLNDYGTSICLDASQNVYIAGATETFAGHFVYAMQKFDKAGKKKWQYNYDFPNTNSDCAYSITIQNNSKVIVTGWSGSFALSTSGSLLWSENDGSIFADNIININDTMSLIGGSFGFKILNTNTGTAIATVPVESGRAYTLDKTNFIYVSNAKLLQKYDIAGNLLWSNELSIDIPIGNEYNGAIGIAVSSNQNIYLVTNIAEPNLVGQPLGRGRIIALKYAQCPENAIMLRHGRPITQPISEITKQEMPINSVKPNKFGVKVIPNPNNGNMNIEANIPENSNDAQFEIINYLGKKVLQQNLNIGFNSIETHAEELNQGIYMALLKINGQIVRVEKIMVAK